MTAFPDFSEEVHDALDELEDQSVSTAVDEALARDGTVKPEDLLVHTGERREALRQALAVASPALDALAVEITLRLVHGAVALVEDLRADPGADPTDEVSDVGYESPELARLEEIRHNPTLALVSGHPDASARTAALGEARARLNRVAGAEIEATQAWSWHPTLAAMQQLLRPSPEHWLALTIGQRHAHARAGASAEQRDPGHMIGAFLRAAYLPAVVPAERPSGRPAHPALTRFRLEIFEGAGPVVRSAALAADRPDLTGVAQGIAAHHEDTEAALTTFAELAERNEAPAPESAPIADAGDPPLRKITWWRVFVFLLLLGGSIYMYLLR